MITSRVLPGGAELRLSPLGALRAETAAGISVLPRGRKAQAILFYLALCGEPEVPRTRLIALLWSSRDIEQGRASLRQSLIEVRQAMKPVAELLRIERNVAALDRQRTWIDALDPGAPAGSPPPTSRLFETLLGLDPRFDAWIHGLRSEHAAQYRPRSSAPAGLRLNSAESTQPEPGARRLLLGVAPILKLGASGLDEFTAPALTQELVTALSRFRWMNVRFSPDGGHCDYRVEGYLIPVDAATRIVLRLIDARNGEIVVWSAEKVTDSHLPPGAMSDLVESVVQQIDPEILAIETRKAMTGAAETQDGYACTLHALAQLYRFEQDSWIRAGELLARGRALDPNYARAYAVSALALVTGIAQGWSTHPSLDLAQVDLDAARAIELDPRDSLGLALSGHLDAFVHHDFDSACALFERAIAANPSCGFAWGYYALTHAYMGRPEQARSSLERALEIMRYHPFLSFLQSFAVVTLFFARDWSATVAQARVHLRIRPRFSNLRKLLIGSLCHLGMVQDARAEHALLLLEEPGFEWLDHLQRYPFHSAADREDLRGALARTGLIPPPRLHATTTSPASLAPALSARTSPLLKMKELR